MNRTLVAVTVVLSLTASLVVAEQAAPLGALAKMPVKEITVFKDGHAFVLHAGRMPTDASGNVLMDYLPTPVLGTFWPYSADKKVKLSAVVASKRKVLVKQTALTLRELLEANVEAEVFITETDNKTYLATIVGIPTRSSKELEATSPPNSGEKLPQKGGLILLKTDNGVKAVKIDRIRDVTFKGEHRSTSQREEFRNLLTLKLGWKGKPKAAADVGMMYLQKGVRWIPHYKITIDSEGKAHVKLQATLINELTDLEGVTVHLVVGVPTFQFKDTVDPISLQRQAAQLSQYFRQSSQSAYAMSNAIMSQVAYNQPVAVARPAGVDLGPAVAGSQRNEDLFVFDIKNVTLKKGQRMVIPVTEFTIPYRDVYTLDIPFTPPAEVWGSVRQRYWQRSRSSRNTEVARMFHAPKVMHKIRLTNKSKYPLTTAPALILCKGKVLAQGMMQYTSAGSEVDLTVTTAVDIRVEKDEKQTNRTPNAMKWNGYNHARIDLAGKIKLTNYCKKTTELEITRHVLGNVGKADQDGQAEMVNVLEDPGFAPSGGRYWWQWYSWPGWWHHVNGIGRITWKLKLDAGKSVDLKYNWYYYWR